MLAEQSKLGVATVRRAEAAEGQPSITEANLAAIRATLEAAGVEFIPENGGGAGVRLKIFVDAAQPAILHYAGIAVNCLTLQEAVLTWYRLPADQKADATIRVANKGGAIYSSAEIARLHYAPTEDFKPGTRR